MLLAMKTGDQLLVLFDPSIVTVKHVLRTLRKEHYSQAEIDHLFISIVLPNFRYSLSVYGASESDLTVIQIFLD